MTNPKVDRYGNVFHFDDENRYHCENAPAIEWQSGAREWYLHGQLHREDGPARETKDGTKEWYLHDKLHREDGPAREMDSGTKEWFFEGLRHRGDGPAIITPSGTKEWWWFGKPVPDSPVLQESLTSLSGKVAPGSLKEIFEKALEPVDEQTQHTQSSIEGAIASILEKLGEIK